MSHVSRYPVPLRSVLLLASLCSPARALAQQALTLPEALAEAEARNARLPPAAAGVAIARQDILANRARLLPGVFLDGDVHDGAPTTYASGDARLQLIAADTLYNGGRVRAGLRIAEFGVRAAGAGYRMAVNDVDLEVRLRFSEGVRFQREVAIRTEGIGRLRAYLEWLEARQAGGQGVAADVLKTRTRVAEEEANIADAERQLDEAQVELNDLMGRDPRAEVALEPPPPPAAPSRATGEPWLQTPDVIAAQASAGAAQAAIELFRADRRPTLWVAGNVGWQPTFGPQAAPLNTGSGQGAEFVLGFTWPVFDFGGYAARLAQAQLAARQARDSLLIAQRLAHLNWARAVEDLEDLYRVYQLRTRNVPLARDSYLEAEARYRGGAGLAIEVLDAYSAWIDAAVTQAESDLQYRQAEAELIRWGTP